jgi:N-acetylglucosamine malate deacetylase 1
MNQCDLLAFGAHPDDVEISAGGTVAKMVARGKRCAIVDLTAGELGTRGNAVLRIKEAADAAAILGVQSRENLGMADGFFSVDRDHIMEVVRSIRHFKPEVVIANSITDRHPDHGKAAELVAKACFFSGLPKVETTLGGVSQQAHRPRAVYNYIQDYYIQPSFVVDISEFFEAKMNAIKAFSSQFYRPESNEPKTPISGREFYDFLKGRAMQMGRPAGFTYAEGFTSSRLVGVDDLFDLL